MDESKQYDLIVVDPIFEEGNDHFLALYGKLAKAAKESASIFVFTDWKNSLRVQNIIGRKTDWTQHNEIVWSRMSPGKNSRKFKNGFEKILHYSPNPSKIVYHEQFRELTGKDVLPYKNEDGSPRGWFYDESTGTRIRNAETNNVWCYTRPAWSAEELTKHPMQKPLMLADRLILSSTDEEAEILDCYAGSGTFACSAKMLNRNYAGYEISPEFCKAIEDRLEGLGSLKGYPDKTEGSLTEFF